MTVTRARLLRVTFAIFLFAGAGGYGAVWTRSTKTLDRQRPGTCQIGPPQIHVPTGEWTATETILKTYAIDTCTGERLIRPIDFRRRCKAGHCKTYLYSVNYYGISVAEVVPTGRGRYLATFRPVTVPCPHRPREDTGTNQDHGTITLWWAQDKQILRGLSQDYQVGICGGNPAETASYEIKRTNPTAMPPAEGP